jgi:16S rRNA (cytidine1402-2'-O)-methyltransferase
MTGPAPAGPAAGAAGSPSGRAVATGLPDGPCLVLVATPIGNLGDLSPRAAAILGTVDVIACEDTRHTRKLLSALGIPARRLIAVHAHNEQAAAAGIVALLAEGLRVALVSDAGTPGISDPGAAVVAAVRRAGLPVLSAPGPVAFISALIISGLTTDRFVMEGFLPVKGGERRRRIATIASEPRTVVLYEAPHRIIATLDELAATCGADRRVSVSRELTKRFESTWAGVLGEASAAVGDPRGEYVIVLEGAPEPTAGTVPAEDLDAALLDALGRGASVRDAAAAASSSTGAPRAAAYARALELRKRD